MTVHRDYANKSCPGEYLYGKHGYIADEVNKLLGVAAAPSAPAAPQACKKYVVLVTAESLNYRTGPGTNFKIAGAVTKGGMYTIVAEADGAGASKWGRLKSGAGWISLDFCKRK